MKDQVIKVYKKVGETPLDCINIIKKNDPQLISTPMTYAGRLDPLAEGVLLILTGDECHNKDEYLKLPKEYEIEILFGFATDTYDVMGKIIKQKGVTKEEDKNSSDIEDVVLEESDHENLYDNFAIKIKKTLENFTGLIKQSYPPYSSRPVNGKPLFMWAREGKLDEIEIPEHNVLVEKIETIEENSYSGIELLNKIKEDIEKVKGDFRQQEIIKIWENELKNKEKEKYLSFKLRISCGSGAYMRSIANDIGETLGVPALALKIIRTKVGDYSI